MIIACQNSECALDGLVYSAEMGSVISWESNGDDYKVHLGAMTAFGPIYRQWETMSLHQLRLFINETLSAGLGKVWLSGPEKADPSSFFKSFATRSAHIPVRKDKEQNMAVWWTRTKIDGDGFTHGEMLRPHIEPAEQGFDIRYRNFMGKDAGLHAHIKREATQEEKQLIDSSLATIERFSFNLDTDENGEDIRVQVLMLSIPHSLATAFSDGILPRDSIIFHKEA